MNALIEMVRQLMNNIAERSMCKPAWLWRDDDTKDNFSATATKDGEWIVVTRVSNVRNEIVTFDIPREAFAHVIKQLGGTL